jgi:hypothetical protein
LKIRSYLRQSAGSIAFAVISCGILSLLLSPIGPFNVYLHVNLGFVIIPLVGYYILWLCSRLSRATISGSTGFALSYILNGAAFSFLCYGFLSNVDLLSLIPQFAGIRGFLIILSYISPSYAILIISIVVLRKVLSVFVDNFWEVRIVPFAIIAAEAFAGYSIWQSLFVYSDSWIDANKLGFVLYAGILALVVSDFSNYGKKVGNRFVIDISRWLSSTAASVVLILIGGFSAAYLLFIRTWIYSVTPLGFLFDWEVICLAIITVMIGLKIGLENTYSGPVTEVQWPKHSQKVNDIVDSNFNTVVKLQRDFVENGDRADILNYLNNVVNQYQSKERANLKLQQIIDHTDKKTPWYSFATLGYWKRNVFRSNRQQRRLVMDTVVKELGDTLSYAQRKS